MKRIIVVLLLCVGFTYVSAQEVYNSSGKPGYHKKTKKNKGYDPSKLILGGGLQAGFGDGYAVAGISPMVGYKFTSHFAAGVGIGYLYEQAPDPNWSTFPPVYYDKENIVYPNLWARYFVWRGLYLTGAFEYDFISLKAPVDYLGDVGKLNVNAQCLLAGLGIKQPLGGRASFFIELMWDFLQQPYSPYLGQPDIRAGIAVGL
jgi:hypothetical protein